MVYSYLLELYNVLDERKKEIECQKSKISEDSEHQQYQQGRYAAITDFTEFLQTNYHAKLPRRLQKHRR